MPDVTRQASRASKNWPDRELARRALASRSHSRAAETTARPATAGAGIEALAPAQHRDHLEAGLRATLRPAAPAPRNWPRWPARRATAREPATRNRAHDRAARWSGPPGRRRLPQHRSTPFLFAAIGRRRQANWPAPDRPQQTAALAARSGR